MATRRKKRGRQTSVYFDDPTMDYLKSLGAETLSMAVRKVCTEHEQMKRRMEQLASPPGRGATAQVPVGQSANPYGSAKRLTNPPHVRRDR